MSSFGRFTQALGGVVESLSYISPTLTLTQSVGVSPLTTTIAGGGGISGSGTPNYLPKWITATSQGNSILSESAGILYSGGAFISTLGFIYANQGTLVAKNSGTFGNWQTDAITLGYSNTGTYAWIQSGGAISPNSPLVLQGLGGNILIGTSVDSGYKLNVSGSIRSSTIITLNNGFDRFTADSSGVVTWNAAGFGGILTWDTNKAIVAANSTNDLQLSTAGGSLLISGVNGGSLFSSTVSVGSLTNGRLGVRGTTNDSSAYAFEAANLSGATLFIVRNDGFTFLDNILSIGTFSPDASAKVQIESTTQGLLVPRMLESEITAITSPADGLLVYNLNQQVHCFWNGGGWYKYNHSPM